ncbi:hypothetical protein I308_106343 [Cryptococcus tetragattii IND107]|uniref:Uncharacterized protein n=1 Tax=Cryptococcus tetragattii IND107 TaxID=1296105 RepID=A0ABR3BIM5_9TREE
MLVLIREAIISPSTREHLDNNNIKSLPRRKKDEHQLAYSAQVIFSKKDVDDYSIGGSTMAPLKIENPQNILIMLCLM